MNFSYFIARKVAGSGRASFSRLIIRIAVVAVALSMTVMIVTTSLIRGFKTEISNKIFGFWGHIHITDTNVTRSFESVPFKIDTDFVSKMENLDQVVYWSPPSFLSFPSDGPQEQRNSYGGIRHVQAYAQVGGIITINNEFESVYLKGVSHDFDWENMQQYMIAGEPLEFPKDSILEDIIISQSTSQRLGLDIGDAFVMYFVKKQTEIARRFSVSGIYKTGLEEFDKRFALTDIRRVQDLLGWEDDEIGGYEVFIDDIRDLDPLNEHIYVEELPNQLFSQTIKDKFPGIFEWLELQDVNEIVILVLMIMVSVINMITAMMILILERTNMIGILKALGSRDWEIRKIFLYYASYIILMGLFWGNLIGIGLCLIQEHFEIIQLSEADYYLSTAPIQLNLWIILALNIGTIIITILFLIIPTYLITSVSPVKAIRFK